MAEELGQDENSSLDFFVSHAWNPPKDLEDLQVEVVKFEWDDVQECYAYLKTMELRALFMRKSAEDALKNVGEQAAEAKDWIFPKPQA